MSPGAQVAAALANAPAVTTLAGSRIFPMRMPPTTTFPAVVYTGIERLSMAGFSTGTAGTLKQSRVQVDSYAKTYDDAHELDDAIADYLTALEGASASITVEFAGSRDLYENDTQLHRVSTDFIVWST
jgi:hypothetical protein